MASSSTGQPISCAPATAQAGGKPLPLPCWVIEQPTADASGSQGFAAAASGNATVSRATYNADSQLLLYERYANVAPASAASPSALPGMRQPDERRSYAYAAAQDANFMRGNLQTLTVEYPSASPAVAPQITRFTRYDRAGRMLTFAGADDRNPAVRPRSGQSDPSNDPRNFLKALNLK